MGAICRKLKGKLVPDMQLSMTAICGSLEGKVPVKAERWGHTVFRTGPLRSEGSSCEDQKQETAKHYAGGNEKYVEPSSFA